MPVTRSGAMNPLPAILRVYRSADPSDAFLGLADSIGGILPLRCALYVRGRDRAVRDCWPQPTQLTDDLLDAALHVLRPEVFPLGSEFPSDASRFPDAEVLLLPLRRDAASTAVCLFVADAGAFGEDLQPWGYLASAVQDFEARHQRLMDAEGRCEELQRRVEETEALHTLGLAANRTLHQGEVLTLVARFTRTLLGAHYVTVNTIAEGRINTVASVGLRDAGAAAEEYQLARAVVEAEKPLTVGGADAALQVANFPFHQAEGMRAGLGIPLSLFGDTFGALIVGYRSDYTVTPHDTRLALTLAGHAAVAISNARLHETVAQRSRELEAAYAELDEVTRAKERFFASINHELRNPIGAVLGYLTLVLDGTAGEVPERARVFLEKAGRAAATLRALVDDILDLSKLAAGKMEVHLRPCTLDEIVDDVLNTIQPLAEQRGIPLHVSSPEALPPLETDPGRVQQILVNLLSNAVKFTGDGGVQLQLLARDLGWVEFRVIDTGPGIEPEDLKRIFEEYEQVKGTKGGTGLGLPVSRRLARALGGELWAESASGAGSTFVLALPRRDVGEDREESSVSAGTHAR